MRRRTAVEQITDATLPPAWTQQTVVGLAYAAALTGGGGLQTLSPVLTAARVEWCRDNGCHRRPRTCTEVFGKPSAACQSPAAAARKRS